jgi:nitrite reductase/ring-hydroxylating ferredoxin subunit
MTKTDRGRRVDEAAAPGDAPSGPAVDRRAILRAGTVGGLGLPLLGACGSASSAGSTGSSRATLATSAVPVGGGKILTEQKVVVTQPAKGEFKAFTAVCTHQGCVVDTVQDGQIICPCHRSHFSIEDGSPTSGPARTALAEKHVSVKSGRISVT